MIRRKLIWLLIAMLPLAVYAQKYDALWEKVDEAAKKDLPRTQLDLLETISQKAEKGKDYGNFLSARLMRVSVMASLSPDSAEVEKARLKAGATAAEKKDPVFSALYYAVLGNVEEMEGGQYDQSRICFEKALSNPNLLAKCKTDKYKPLISEREDSRIFNDDLLHVIAMEAGQYRLLYNFYKRNGNRRAACIAASRCAKDTTELDSLIDIYGDLPESGELAKKRYSLSQRMSTKARVEYIDQALKRWADWPYMGELVNARKNFTNSGFSANMERRWVRPGQSEQLILTSVRNIKQLEIIFTRLNVQGNTDLQVSLEKDYKEAQSKKSGETSFYKILDYSSKAEYELTNDTIDVPSLPVGIYLIEYRADGKVLAKNSNLYYVSDLYVISEEQPGNRIRYVVVNATTGQPVPNADVNFITKNIRQEEVKTVKADDKGEVIYTYTHRKPSSVFVTTDTDKFCPKTSIWTNFDFYPNRREEDVVNIYTDRSIYRPGQVVHASAIVSHRSPDLKREVLGEKNVHFILYNANHKKVAEKSAFSDAYGVAAASFTLPSDGLTGRFTVKAEIDHAQSSATISVEEYKRPTFEVTFPKYKERYAQGDTIQLPGVAKTYGGVPVQGATVKYTVKRSHALWWHSYYNSRSDATVSSGTVTTEGDGTFKVPVPFIIPKTSYSCFYHFVVEAKVTDGAGESHEASTVLPLGNKATALSSDLPIRSLNDSLKQVTFYYKNAAGEDISGKVTYTIDGGTAVTVPANKPHRFAAPLKSGEHHIVAICGNDTLKSKVMVFALTDKKPVVYTKDWFYVTDTKFRKDGKPVYVQIGSSEPDQHIVYSVIAGDSLIENGVIDQSEALNTRPFTYRKVYGDGVTLTYAWVKNGVCYTHSARIAKPLPDKRLILTWKTFRDKLTPGQKEQWTLNVKHPDGKPAGAQLMATLYDKSLDQIKQHNWSLSLMLSRSLASTDWHSPSTPDLRSYYSKSYKREKERDLKFSIFNDDLFRNLYGYGRYMSVPMAGARGRANLYKTGAVLNSVVMTDSYAVEKAAVEEVEPQQITQDESPKGEAVQIRENMNETAFFYPQLVSDAQGNVNLKFTLPESITTWRLIGLAHDKDMNNGLITAEAVASKKVMVQPNMPRFVRQGDEAQLAARLFNSSQKGVTGVATLELIDPETEKVLKTVKKNFSVGANGTANIVFPLDDLKQYEQTILIARTTAKGEGFSDGEQHYLPILPDKEMVTNTLPFTQHEAGVKTVDLNRLFPEGTTQQKLTVEYTDNPTWFMIQALPFMADASQKNAISQATAFYANSIGRYIMNASPNIMQAIALWKQEKGKETSLMSNLQKNESLKELAINETPWVNDAENETEQKQALVNFFDVNTMEKVQNSCIDNLKKLQKADGSWSWWPGMEGSIYMTTEISKTFVRLNKLIGKQQQTEKMLSEAFNFMADKMHEEVNEMKKLEKKRGYVLRPSELAVDYLYTCAIDGRKLSSKAEADKDYLVKRLTGRATELTIYGKAMTAVILAHNGYRQEALEHLQSIKEYTVFTEEMGRYFDTRKAYYSWCDYRIPTEVATIEAMKALTSDDLKTIEEMQRWLLMCKRTQAWDTPVNSVNAVFAFSEKGKMNALTKKQSPTALKLDGQQMELPKATAGLGYMKTTQERKQAQTFSAEKTSGGTSWGAVYAQFMQPVTNIATSQSGITVVRELLNADTQKVVDGPVKVGDKLTVRITITADRDYDFVQVVDKRAACMEPAGQLSGYNYRFRCYIAPKDYTTNFYFDQLSKGKHVISADYYVDREGAYQTGTCTAQCAYAPEYSGRDKAVVIRVNALKK